MWLLHWLPLPVLAVLGRALGLLLYLLVRERRHVTLINLGLCFPHLSPTEKSVLARRHIAEVGDTCNDHSRSPITFQHGAC